MRVQQLECFLTMLNEMEILINFRAMRFFEIIKEISIQDNFKNFEFLQLLNKLVITEESDMTICWKKAAKDTIFITEEDRKIFYNVGEQLGSSDIEGQISMIEMNKKLIEVNLSDARKELTEKGKLLKTVWSLMGVAVGIMII